jgi:hypothetical protein
MNELGCARAATGVAKTRTPLPSSATRQRWNTFLLIPSPRQNSEAVRPLAAWRKNSSRHVASLRRIHGDPLVRHRPRSSGQKTPRLRGPPSDQSPAAHLTRHDREHFSTIVNSAPRGALNCSPSRGNLFTLPWNPCSRSRGNPVHHRVEYAISSFFLSNQVLIDHSHKTNEKSTNVSNILAWGNF